MEVFQKCQLFSGLFAAVNTEIAVCQDAEKNDFIISAIDIVTVHIHVGKRDLVDNHLLLRLGKPHSLHNMRRMACRFDDQTIFSGMGKLGIKQFRIGNVRIDLKKIARALDQDGMCG